MSELKRGWEEEFQSRTGAGIFTVLVCLGVAAVCSVCVAPGRELMDVLGREDFFSAFLPPWQRVALAKILAFWEGNGGGALALKILGG